MTDTTPAALRDAADVLDDMPAPPRTVTAATDEENHRYATQYTIAFCDHDHAPPALIDRDGCCQDCRYVFTYDRELADAVATLMAIPAPLRDLLKHAAWLAETDEARRRLPSHDHAVNLARTITQKAASQ